MWNPDTRPKTKGLAQAARSNLSRFLLIQGMPEPENRDCNIKLKMEKPWTPTSIFDPCQLESPINGAPGASGGLDPNLAKPVSGQEFAGVMPDLDGQRRTAKKLPERPLAQPRMPALPPWQTLNFVGQPICGHDRRNPAARFV
jgi:hypothetical protein